MKRVHDTLAKVNQYIKSLGLQGQVTFRGESSHLVRCGRSQISLNVSHQSSRFHIELIQGKKRGEATLSCALDDWASCTSTIDQLKDNLEFLPSIEYLKPFPPIAQGGEYQDLTDLDNQEAIDSKIMVHFYQLLASHFDLKEVEISGAFSAGHSYYALINTDVQGPISFYGSDYNMETVLQLIQDQKKEIRTSCVGTHLQNFDPTQNLLELKNHFKIKKSTPRKEWPRGQYDIIFSASAFAEITAYMTWIGLSGECYEYKNGMLQKDKHKLGDQIFGRNITIIDDPTSEDTLFPRGFGLNGIQRKRFSLIEKGVLKNLFYSNKDTCDRFDVPINNDSNVASLKLAAGQGPSDLKDILEKISKPTLLINYLHYMNFTNAAKGEFTTTSRFGTYLLEPQKGITSHLYNVRINDSYHRIFNSIEWLSQSQTNVNLSHTYGLRAPRALTLSQYTLVNNVPITDSSLNS